MAEPITLTPEQEAEYNQKSAALAPQPINPIRDFDAPTLAELSVKDPSFNLVDTFRQNKDLWADPATVQKVADAHNLVKQRGFKVEDIAAVKAAKEGDVLGTAEAVVKPAWDIAKGFGKQIWNYATAATMPLVDIAGAVTGQGPGFTEELGKIGTRAVAENIAGTEQAVTGLGEMAGKAVGKIGRAVGLAKPLEQFTPEEKAADLWNAVGTGETQEDIGKGHGGFLTPVGGEVIKGLEESGAPVRPEETATTAAGDPFSWWAFGKAFQGAGKAVPPAVAASAGKLATAAGETAAKIGGGAIEVLGKAQNVAGKAVSTTGKVAEFAAPVIGAAEAIHTGSLTPLLTGGFAGIAGKRLASVGKAASKAAEGVKAFGQEVAGARPVVSPYAQTARDVLQSAPGAVGEVAKGAAFDLGLGAATSETPTDTSGLGVGATFGLLGAGRHLGGHVLSGQLIAPRDYGVSTPQPSSGQFPAFDAMHQQAFDAATPAQKARLNAIRLFTNGAAPGTDVFMGHSTTIADALMKQGVSPEQAAQFADQEGFFTVDLPGADGKAHKVIVVKDVAAAPHESFHAIQDVIGEPGNRQIDEVVKQAYGPQWDAQGQTYAQRLIGGKLPGTWQETILDKSGWGQNEAKEKIIRRVQEQLGADADPATVQAYAKEELGRLTDEALARNSHLDPASAQEQVWRDILSPQEAQEVADRYLARELAAENFDAVLKHTGEKINSPIGLLPRLAQVVGEVVSAFGGNPLAGRRTEIGRVEPQFPVTEAVKAVAKNQLPEVVPVGKPAAKGPKRVITIPGTPAARTQEAENAATAAASAPDAPTARGGRSPRELLGQVSEAIANGTGVKINYLSAPDEPAAATTSNRETRRAIIETYRTMPAEARALWEKSFFPDKVITTKGGGYQIQGWAPEVFAANAHKMAATLAKIGITGTALSPYPIDAATGSFTPEGWKQLYSDTQTFVNNQQAGRTGSGESLVVPKEVADQGIFAPQVKPGAEVPLDQHSADFINALFNFKLPETPRMQKGKIPLNIAGQEVSAATLPGRVSIPVRPRGAYEGAPAEALGIAGRDIAEVNPVRNAIEAAAQKAGVAMPSLIEAIQKLNLENIKEIEHAPELPEFRGNTLTLTAGFQPESAAVKGVSDMLAEKNVKDLTARAFALGKQISTPAEVQQLVNMRTQARGQFADMMERFKNAPREKKMEMLDSDEWRDNTVREQIVNEALEKATGYNPAKMEAGDVPPVPMSAEQIKTLETQPITAQAQSAAPMSSRQLEDIKDQSHSLWVSPSGKTYDAVSSHKDFVQQHPDLFAVDPDTADSVGDAKKKGWVRVVWSGSTSYPILAEGKVTQSVKRALEDLNFAVGEPGVSLDGNHTHLRELIAPREMDGQFQAKRDESSPSDLLSKEPEAIRYHGAAIRNNETKKIYTGETHYDALDKMLRETQPDYTAGNPPLVTPKGITEGFLTNNGEFLDRKAAFKRAREFDQVNDSDYMPRKGELESTSLDYALRSRIREGMSAQAQPARNEAVAAVADDYAERTGRTLRPSTYEALPEAALKRIADHYEQASHDPANEAVRESYDALAKETEAQYRAITDAGYVLEPFPSGADPYKNSADMAKDVADNKHLYYYPTTTETFGNEATAGADSLMLAPSGVDGIPYNDLFRAVHDFFGHAKQGLQFGPRGEFNAWREHAPMYSPEAQAALAAETLAQNAWVNFGPHLRNVEGNIPAKGEEGYVAPASRRFAEQKNIALPADLIASVSGQAQPKAKADKEFKMLRAGPGGFSKAWILPGGKVEQLGGQWHHSFLADTSAGKAAAKAAGLKIPPFEGTDAEGVRESALQKGFARVNYDVKSGTMTIEARAADWPKQKASVQKLVEANLDNIDNLRVSLLNEHADPLAVDSQMVRLFQLDTDAQKIAAIPFMNAEARGARATLTDNPAFTAPGEEAAPLPTTRGETQFKAFDKTGTYVGKYNVRADALKAAGPGGTASMTETFSGQAQPGRQQEEMGFEDMGKKVLSTAEQSVMTKAELAAHFPESVIPRKNDEPIPSAIKDSPLYKEAGSEEAAVKSFADKLVEIARGWENDPRYQSGLKWYSEFVPMLKSKFGADAPIMAEFLAATSPQNAPESNYAYAVDALEGMKSGRFDRITNKYGEGIKKLEDGSWEKWAKKNMAGVENPTPAAFMGEWIATHDLLPRQSNGQKYGISSTAVLQVLARRWLQNTQGPKTQNFVQNLLGTGHGATIDLWADRTMRRAGYSGFKDRWRILPKNATGVTDADFYFSQKAFAKAAEELGILPDALQGGLWFAEKAHWNREGWGRLDLGDYRKEVPKTEALQAGIRERTRRTTARTKQKEAKPGDLFGDLLVQPRNLQ